MSLYRKSNNPAVLYLIGSLRRLLSVIENYSDNIFKESKELLGSAAIIAIKDQDAELFSVVLYINAKFLTRALKLGNLEIIALFFELEPSAVLILAKMQKQQYAKFFMPFLYNYNIMKFYNDRTIEQIPPVAFRLAVFQQLQEQQVPDSLPLLNGSATVAKLLRVLQHFLVTKEQTAIKYIINIMPYLIEDAVVYGNAQDLAAFIARYLELLINSQNRALKVALLEAIGLEVKSFPAELELFAKDFSLVLMWLTVNTNTIFGKIARTNGISHEQLVKFQDEVSIALAKLKQQATLLPNFSELLLKLTATIKAKDVKELPQQRTTKYSTLVHSMLAHLVASIKHLDSVALARQIVEVITVSISYYQQGARQELAQLFDWSINDLEQCIILLQAKAYGQLAWHYLNQTLQIAIVAEQDNIPFLQYVAFKREVYAELTKLLAMPVLPEPITLNAEILAIARRVNLLEDNKFFIYAKQITMLFREAYEQKDSKTFAALIHALADLVKELYAIGSLGISNLMFILQIIPKQMLELMAVLKTQDPNKLSKILIAIVLGRWSWDESRSSLATIKRQLFIDKAVARYKMQLGYWQGQKPEENYLLKAREFQFEVYFECGLVTEVEEFVNFSSNVIFPWDKVLYPITIDANTWVDGPNGAVNLARYKAEIKQNLMTDNFLELEQYRIMRRQFLDIFYFRNNAALYAEFVYYDLEMLLLAFAEAKIAQVQILLNISIEKIKFYYTLYKEQAFAELSWHLLHAISCQDIAVSLAIQAQPDIIKLQAEACQLLMVKNRARGGCELPTGAQLCHKLEACVLETEIANLPQLANGIAALLQNLIKQSKHYAVAIQQLAEFLYALVAQSIAIYQAGNKNIVILLQALVPLELEEIELLFIAKHSKLLVWQLLNSSKIFYPIDMHTDLMLPQLNQGKIATIVALKKCYGIPSQDEFFQADENFSIAAIATTDVIKLRLFRLESVAKIISQIQRNDHLDCAQSLLTMIALVRKVKEKFPLAVDYLLKIPVNLAVEYHHCLQQENYGLLARLIYLEILRENLGQVLVITNQEIGNFSKVLFQELAKLLTRPTLLWSPEEVVAKYEVLFALDGLLLQKQQAMEELYILSVTMQRALVDAYELNDPEQYAVWVRLQTEMLLKAYQLGKQEVLFKMLNLKYEDVPNVLAILRLQNIAALQAWYLEYGISAPKDKPWSLMLSKMQWQGDNQQNYVLPAAFKAAVSLILAIEPIEPFLVKKIQQNMTETEFQVILNSIKKLANQHFDLKVYEEKLCNLGKSPIVAELLQLEVNIPAANDSREYQEIYQLLQAIWHAHILGHSVSTMIAMIKFGKFNLRWEGSSNFSMVEIMQHSQQEFIRFPENIAKIAKICRQVVPTIEVAEIAKFITFLTQEINKIIAINITGDIAKKQQNVNEAEFNDKLRNGELIAIAVCTYFSEAHASHASGALFLEDIFVKADRGGDAAVEFSGISFYQMSCSQEARAAIIKELATTEYFTNEYYKELQKNLQLKLIHRIPMLRQEGGNCGHASCAELLHFGVAIFEVAKLLMAKQQQSFIQVLKTACVVAKQINTLVMQYQQLKMVTKLLDLLQAPNNLLLPPYEFLTHVYLIAKFQLGHQSVANKLANTGYITLEQCNKFIAYHGRIIALSLQDELSAKAREILQQELLITVVTEILQGYLTIDDGAKFKETYRNGVICLEYGITSKQLQALFMVPRPLGNEPQSLVITISNAVIANMLKSWQRLNNDRLMNSLLVEILAAARKQGIVQQVSWHEVMPGVYWPKLIKLKVSIQEFLAFITKTMQLGSHPGSELLLPLFTSASKAQKISSVMPSGMAIKDTLAIARNPRACGIL